MNKSLYTVRKKKHEDHPQVIVDSNRTMFTSLEVTHSKGRKKHWNVPLNDNPNPDDEKQSYFVKKFIEDFKFNYSKAWKNYKLSDKDIEQIIEFLKTKQK